MSTVIVRTFDVVVIGAGPVGENVADRAVQGGLTCAIVEAELVGGECSYWACMPTKALLRPGNALAAARRVPGAREAVGSIDVPAALAFREAAAARGDDSGQVEWLEGAGITLVRGHGALGGERRVRVTRADGEVETLEARHAVALATGSEPVVPPVLRGVEVWGSREAVRATAIPPRLAVVGGGVVGCELATAYAALGSQVTLLVRGDRLLPSHEPVAGELVADALRAAGVDLRLGTAVTDATAGDDGAAHLTLDGAGSAGAGLAVDRVVAATGRRPRTRDLGLASVGLAQDEAPQVDDTMLVDGTDWLYAVGDVNGRALLTHQGKYQARAAGDAIAARATGAPLDDGPWGRHVATADHAVVPQVVFTDPEVAAVGRTAAQAEEAGLPVRVVDLDLGAIAGATVHAEGYTGAARFVLDAERDVVLGATFVGQDVAEMVHAATVAVVGEVPLHRLWHVVPSYPTLSEVWLRMLEQVGRQSAQVRA